MNIAIIVGLNEEKAAISKMVGIEKPANNFVFPALIGKYNGNNVLLVRCGPGKVNSTIAAFNIIKTYSPDIVISCGLAGASVSGLMMGDIVIADKVIQHDAIAYANEKFSRRLLRVHKNKRWSKIDYLTCDKRFTNLSQKILVNFSNKNKVYTGIIATGDQLILSKKYRGLVNKIFGATAIDMESAAIAHVCHMFDIKFGCLRIISDNDDLVTNRKGAPSLIRDRVQDVKTCSTLCAEALKHILSKM